MLSFNSKGEINASSKQDALQQIIRYASVLQEGVPTSHSLASTVSEEKAAELIEAAIHDQHAKYSLAQAMANPIRKNLDYHGVARRGLVVDPVDQGEFVTYELDIDVQAVVVSAQGSGPESRIFGERASVELFELYSNPTIRYSEARRRRFNAIDRAIQKARQELMAQEDVNFFGALDVAATVENTAQDINDAALLKRDLIDIKKQIDGWDNVTAKYFMNINEFTDILKWGAGGGQGSTGGDFDPVSMREVLQTGLYGQIFGADIIVSKLVPPGTVYGCADPEFVGVMPVRQDIQVIPADEPKQLKLGWVVTSELGIGILNSRSVAVGRKTTLTQ